MSRTDDIRQGGASDRTGSGGGAPFVKWPKDKNYAWVEGRVKKIWNGRFGPSATLEVSSASDGLVAKGKNESGEETVSDVRAGEEVNVGLNSSALQDTLDQDDVGENVHIAFEGWVEAKGSGNAYRLFTVLVLDERGGVGEETVGASVGEAGPGHPDNDDLPF